MWFPVDDGMVNLGRVAYIKVGSYEVQFFNDARAELTTATFSSEEELRKYVERLQEELPYPLGATERDRFPAPREENLLEVVEEGEGDEK